MVPGNDDRNDTLLFYTEIEILPHLVERQITEDSAQTQRLRSMWIMDGSKLRIRVNLDTSYQQQSEGTCERWDGTQWHEVVSLMASEVEPIPFEGRRSISPVVYQKKKEEALKASEKELLRRATLVLGEIKR